MTIKIEDIKKLRDTTGAGMMDAKAALEEAKGDFDKAVEVMRLKGIAKAGKKADRVASMGVIESYVHSEKIGVLVEINCETDFIARTDDFKAFARDVAMHIAAASPECVDRDSVNPEALKKETATIEKEVAAAGKPAEFAQKIIDGKLAKWYEQICLVNQPFIKDPDKTIDQLTKELIGKLGENIIIKRFSRLELGAE
ncbi:translation elongation factor Ts [Candidatus Saccharibacteria bacterium]|nr:translation elongation factor Ts [Candidatus Saccharibacteria bacterium]